MKFWIGVVSKEHALVGINGNFAQVCHGKKGPLSRMKKDDWLILYSPKEYFNVKGAYQKFVGIGRVISGVVYQFDMGNGFVPFRIDVAFKSCVEAEIRPLINNLTFIKNKNNWGMAFRFGHLEIPRDDFNLIANKMGLTHQPQPSIAITTNNTPQSINEHKSEELIKTTHKKKRNLPLESPVHDLSNHFGLFKKANAMVNTDNYDAVPAFKNN